MNSDNIPVILYAIKPFSSNFLYLFASYSLFFPDFQYYYTTSCRIHRQKIRNFFNFYRTNRQKKIFSVPLTNSTEKFALFSLFCRYKGIDLLTEYCGINKQITTICHQKSLAGIAI